MNKYKQLKKAVIEFLHDSEHGGYNYNSRTKRLKELVEYK